MSDVNAVAVVKYGFVHDFVYLTSHRTAATDPPTRAWEVPSWARVQGFLVPVSRWGCCGSSVGRLIFLSETDQLTHLKGRLSCPMRASTLPILFCVLNASVADLFVAPT